MLAEQTSIGNVITDDVIDDLILFIQNLRSKYPHPLTYDIMRSHPNIERCRIRLIDEYFSVVAEIERVKKPSPKVRRAYLRRLLSPLRKLNRIHPSGENPYLKYDGTYPFIKEKIWIDKEIDIKKCHYDKKRYSINFEYSKPLEWFDTDAKNITIWNEYQAYMAKKKEKDAKRKAMSIVERLKSTSAPAPLSTFDEGKTSVYELYKKWLPELTQEKLTSQDLLDQILVCYTVKRALNGDQKAIEKLYSLYEEVAIGIAVNMLYKRKFNRSEIDDIKQEAKIILTSLISGLRPEYIISSLLNRENTHLKIPLWVENFFFWYFSDHVPKEFDKMKQKSSVWGEVEVDYLLNPIAIVDAYTFWQNSPKRVRKFNSSSFRPNKKTNLTTWLFGINKLPQNGVTSGFMQGRFCQHIDEIIDGYYKAGRQDVNKLQEEKIDDNRVSKLSIDDETIEDVKNSLSKRGFTIRNIEIVIQKLKGFSYAEIANANNLSGRQIIRICNKAKIT